MESDNNSQIIYEYTKYQIEKISESIDLITDKLTKILAFSGVFLKFASDIKPEGLFFIVKILTIFTLILTIGHCAAGLWSRGTKEVDLKPEYLLNDQYGLSEERIRVLIVKSWFIKIQALKGIREDRNKMLSGAIGFLTISGLVYGLSEIINSIDYISHKCF
ncbi:MAG: hypothetical protein MH252_02075 [Thermosynechococcaceae cyanobacterium MS004]|nr:hypothetical protein [Thermosynechococcaceae cyanobacterium MS004]